MAECIARGAEEDALFDVYCALPDRPRPFVMRRVTETSELEPMESFDMDHWTDWYLVHTKMPMPRLTPPSPGLFARIARVLWR